MHVVQRVDSLRCVEHSLLVFRYHCRLEIFIGSICGQCGSLSRCRYRKCNVHVHVSHHLDEVRRSNDVAHTPSGHGEVLGYGVDDNRALSHARQGCERHERVLVAECGVDIIAYHQQVVFLRNGRNLLHGLHGEAAAGRVARCVQNDGLGSLGNQGLQSLHVNLEILFLVSRKLYRDTSRHLHLLRIRCEVRCLKNHFVSVVQNRFHYQMHCQRAGCRNDDFIIRYIHIVFVFIELANLSSQLRIASELRVLGVTCQSILVSLFDYALVGQQVRIAQAQVNHVVILFCLCIYCAHRGRAVFPVAFCNVLVFHLHSFLTVQMLKKFSLYNKPTMVFIV